MEELFEFLFGASNRIDRVKYRWSLLVFSVGAIHWVILLTAAGIAAPLFIIVLAVVFIPWLMWGFAIHTERLHDRDKSAWWLLVFCRIPSILDLLVNRPWCSGVAGAALHVLLALAGFALATWEVVEIGYLRGTAGSKI
jgi:uncharacterized membrane protein YhaH (DUF805 family)